MKRLLVGAAIALVAAFVVTPSALSVRPDCDEPEALCTEPVDAIGYEGAYTGHDEPSLLFYSNVPGSGNSTFYRVQLPSDPKVMPNQSGTAGTWNFQLHPALWFGMALCDNQSAPEFTNAPCTPDSDTNIFAGSDPSSPVVRRQASRHGIPRAPVLPARVGPVAARRQLRRAQVVCGDGDLQLQPEPEHGRDQQRGLPRHRRARAGELRLPDEDRRPARSRRARST